MKKITTLILILTIAILLPALALAEQIYDRGSQTMFQLGVCDPTLHLGTVSANVDLRVGTGGDHNISGWKVIYFWPTTDGTVTMNGDSNKTMPVYSGQINTIAISKNVTQLVFSVGGQLCGSD